MIKYFNATNRDFNKDVSYSLNFTLGAIIGDIVQYIYRFDNEAWLEYHTEKELIRIDVAVGVADKLLEKASKLFRFKRHYITELIVAQNLQESPTDYFIGIDEFLDDGYKGFFVGHIENETQKNNDGFVFSKPPSWLGEYINDFKVHKLNESYANLLFKNG